MTLTHILSKTATIDEVDAVTSQAISDVTQRQGIIHAVATSTAYNPDGTLDVLVVVDFECP